MTLFACDENEKRATLYLDEESYKFLARVAAYSSGQSVVYAFGLARLGGKGMFYYAAPADQPEVPHCVDIRPGLNGAYLRAVLGQLAEQSIIPDALQVETGMIQPRPKPRRIAIQKEFLF